MKPSRRILLAILCADLAVILIAVILGLTKTGNPSRYFGEGRFTTAVSCGQLLLVAFFAFRIFAARRGALPAMAGPVLWLLVGAGFVFLAADDAFKIHERLDGVIHRLLHLQQTALTDRIDDAIIAIYGLIGILVLWVYRSELRPMKAMLPPLLAGFLLLGAGVAFDTLSDKSDIFLHFVGDLALAKKLQGWSDVGDGGCTLLAEGFFVVAFYRGWKATRPAAPRAA